MGGRSQGPGTCFDLEVGHSVRADARLVDCRGAEKQQSQVEEQENSSEVDRSSCQQGLGGCPEVVVA